MAYPKFKRFYQTEGLLHQNLIEAVLKIGKFVKVTKRVKAVLEHPADDKFIECAIAAKADYIVSGDKHLLKVGNYKKISILSVNEFLQTIEAK